MQLILASKSPRRSEILKNAGFSFLIRTADTRETVNSKLLPSKIVMELAKEKAKAVDLNKDEVILAADTIVVLGGKILGKPKDDKDARDMLKSLSGKSHDVYTGVCIISENDESSFYSKTKVYFYGLADEEIAAYVKTGEPLDKAGSYGIQEKGSLLVKKIYGDYFNVMGLPIAQTAKELKKFNVFPRF